MFVYVGRNQNLKDLNAMRAFGVSNRAGERNPALPSPIQIMEDAVCAPRLRAGGRALLLAKGKPGRGGVSLVCSTAQTAEGRAAREASSGSVPPSPLILTIGTRSVEENT